MTETPIFATTSKILADGSHISVNLKPICWYTHGLRLEVDEALPVTYSLSSSLPLRSIEFERE